MGYNIGKIDEKTFKDWFLNRFDSEEIAEMNQIGPEHFGPFMYFADTSMLYRQFDEEIWDLVGEVTDTFYSTTVLGMITQQVGDMCTAARFECQMVWIAAAHLADTHLQEKLGDENNNDEQEEGE